MLHKVHEPTLSLQVTSFLASLREGPVATLTCISGTMLTVNLELTLNHSLRARNQPIMGQLIFLTPI